ncbi:MAG: lipid A deacylase LpxR family protein [Alphaproteobacteria bacterium]
MLLVVFAVAVIFSSPVHAQDQSVAPSMAGRLDVMEENDYFASHDDRHYTQGLRASYVSGPVTPDGFWDQPYGLLADNFPIFDGADRKRKYEWTIAGQSLFTPINLSLVNPSAKDRPYAAWLYTGAGLLQETNQDGYHTLENAELLMGVVGAPALGGVTQNDFHQFIGDTSAMGWKNQIKTEPGFIASYERKWRFEQPLADNLAVDAIPELGASGGNILTYGETGGMVRFGQNLSADYGADRIRPSLSGTGWFDPDQLNGNLGWYLFLGIQARAVGHNIFLDGNTFESSPSVNKKIFVEDFMGGASLFWSSSVRVDFTVTERTREFYGQQGAPDRFGGINIAFQI